MDRVKYTTCSTRPRAQCPPGERRARTCAFTPPHSRSALPRASQRRWYVHSCGNFDGQFLSLRVKVETPIQNTQSMPLLPPIVARCRQVYRRMPPACGGSPTTALGTEHDTAPAASASAHNKARRKPGRPARLTIVSAPAREERHKIALAFAPAAADFDFSTSTEEFYGVRVPGSRTGSQRQRSLIAFADELSPHGGPASSHIARTRENPFGSINQASFTGPYAQHRACLDYQFHSRSVGSSRDTIPRTAAGGLPSSFN